MLEMGDRSGPLGLVKHLKAINSSIRLPHKGERSTNVCRNSVRTLPMGEREPFLPHAQVYESGSARNRRNIISVVAYAARGDRSETSKTPSVLFFFFLAALDVVLSVSPCLHTVFFYIYMLFFYNCDTIFGRPWLGL